MPEYRDIPDPYLPATSHTVIETGPPYLIIVWHTNQVDPSEYPAIVSILRASKFTIDFNFDLDISVIGLN